MIDIALLSLFANFEQSSFQKLNCKVVCACHIIKLRMIKTIMIRVQSIKKKDILTVTIIIIIVTIIIIIIIIII